MSNLVIVLGTFYAAAYSKRGYCLKLFLLHIVLSFLGNEYLRFQSIILFPIVLNEELLLSLECIFSKLSVGMMGMVLLAVEDMFSNSSESENNDFLDSSKERGSPFIKSDWISFFFRLWGSARVMVINGSNCYSVFSS